MAFPWQCPFCGLWATITSEHTNAIFKVFFEPNKYGKLGATTQLITCPNPKCKEIEVNFEFAIVKNAFDNTYATVKKLYEARVIPGSRAKPMPSFIPGPVVEDYNEACAIESLSPKASATLARRCVQGILRDYFKVKPGRLYDEIGEIKGQVSVPLWEAVDDLRTVGNIGAHPEADINLVIDVEPDEAASLIRLIELLIEETYVTRDRQERELAEVRKIAAEKKALKSATSSTALPPGTNNP